MQVLAAAPMLVEGQFGMIGSRPRRSQGNKEVLCTFPGCNKAFYERKNMLQHQTLKHGRPKSRMITLLGGGTARLDWQYCTQRQEWIEQNIDHITNEDKTFAHSSHDAL